MENTNENCPCGSGKKYAKCCEPYLLGVKQAPTAEALMRSRYAAHVKVNVPYIMRTVHSDREADYDEEIIKNWAANSNWQGLEIISIDKGGVSDKVGKVEFKAAFINQKGERSFHHELAQFKKEGDQWFFVDGERPKVLPVSSGDKVGRNSPCPCGSGKKYKKCCGA